MMALGRLIADVSVADFFSEYWEQRYLLSSIASDPERSQGFRELFSHRDLDNLLAATGPRFRDFYRLSKGGNILPREAYSTERDDGLVDFDAVKIIDLYADGATVTINRAHQCNVKLSDLCLDLSTEMKCHANANVYVTPPFAQGFPAHSDTHDVFLLQLSGTKKWRVQQNLEYLANRRCLNKKSDPLTSDTWDEIILSPGDVLYLPRGLMHKGETDQFASIHATIGIHSFLWSDLLRMAVDELELESASLRKSVQFSKDPLQIAGELVGLLEKRLQDSNSLFSFVDKHIASTGEDSRGKLLRATAPPTITEDTRFGIRKNIEVSLEFDNDGVAIRLANRTLHFPVYVEKQLRQILGSNVSANDLSPELDMNGRLTLLKRLNAERVIGVIG